jgi:hypothetical protein
MSTLPNWRMRPWSIRDVSKILREASVRVLLLLTAEFGPQRRSPGWRHVRSLAKADAASAAHPLVNQLRCAIQCHRGTGTSPVPLHPIQCHPCYNASSQPITTLRGLRLPPNCRDVTAEHVGTIFGIVGYPRPLKDPEAPAPSPAPSPAPPERK